MPFQALIHYKNDEETLGTVLNDYWDALTELRELSDAAVESEDGFDPEDVEFAQVSYVEG